MKTGLSKSNRAIAQGILDSMEKALEGEQADLSRATLADANLTDATLTNASLKPAEPAKVIRIEANESYVTPENFPSREAFNEELARHGLTGRWGRAMGPEIEGLVLGRCKVFGGRGGRGLSEWRDEDSPGFGYAKLVDRGAPYRPAIWLWSEEPLPEKAE